MVIFGYSTLILFIIIFLVNHLGHEFLCILCKQKAPKSAVRGLPLVTHFAEIKL